MIIDRFMAAISLSAAGKAETSKLEARKAMEENNIWNLTKENTENVSDAIVEVNG